MTTRHWLPGLFLVLMSTAIGDDEPVGACTYVQENMFAGPFDVCQAPVTEAACTEFGETDDNRDASFADGGECDVEREMVGVCDMRDSTLYYYSGDAFGLEIGCGFQGGEWIAADGEEAIAEQLKRLREEQQARIAARKAEETAETIAEQLKRQHEEQQARIAARKAEAEETAEAARRSAEILEFEDEVQIDWNFISLAMFRRYGVEGYSYAGQFQRCWSPINDESGKLITDVIQKTKSGLEKEGIQWFQSPKVLAIEALVYPHNEANVFFSFGNKPDNYLYANFKFVYSAEMRKDVPEYTHSCTYEYKGYGMTNKPYMRKFAKNNKGGK